MAKLGILETTLTVGVGFSVLGLGCGSDDLQVIRGNLEFDPDRPEIVEGGDAPAYSGSNPFVVEASTVHRTALDLQRNVFVRTCGPTAGVCHNQKEYPDLHTPSNFMTAIGAPCNVQTTGYEAVFDGCEETGDRFQLNRESREIEIGYIDYVPGDQVDFRDEGIDPDETSVGLHIYLHDAVDQEEGRTWTEARFIRTFLNENNEVDNLTFASFTSSWWVLDGGRHLLAEVRNYQVDRVTELLNVGIQQGDMNRNGVYGAREGVPLSMLDPGNPERSYLVGRLRGLLGGSEIPGTRMPLANEPLSISDMLALYCFIEGLPDGMTSDMPLDLDAAIDYENCSYSADPEGLNLLGEGVTWLGRIRPLLESNCGSCHGGSAPIADFDVLSDGVYERLLTASGQNPDASLIVPGDPDASYLWQKITGAEGIVGLQMPLDAMAGVRPLPEAALTDIRTWIEAGAFEEN